MMSSLESFTGGIIILQKKLFNYCNKKTMDHCKSKTKKELHEYLKLKKQTNANIRLTGSKDDLCKQYLKYKSPSPKSSSVSTTDRSRETTPDPYGDSWEAISVDTNYSPDREIKEKVNIKYRKQVVRQIQSYLNKIKPSEYEVKDLQQYIIQTLEAYMEKLTKKKHLDAADLINLMRLKTDMDIIVSELRKIPNKHSDREFVGLDAIDDADGVKYWKQYSNKDKRKFLKVIGRSDLSPTTTSYWNSR